MRGGRSAMRRAFPSCGSARREARERPTRLTPRGGARLREKKSAPARRRKMREAQFFYWKIVDVGAPHSNGRAVLDGGGELAANATTVARLTRELSVLDGHLAAQDHHGGPAVHLPSVPGAVVGAVKVRGARRRRAGGLKPDHMGAVARASMPFRG